MKALYDYTATIDEEFDFQAGDIIAVTTCSDDGWWNGALLVRSSLLCCSLVLSNPLTHAVCLGFLLRVIVGRVSPHQGKERLPEQ